MTIGAIIEGTAAVISVACDTPLREAVEKLARHRIGAMPVVQDDAVVGIMSERDIIRHLATDGAAVLDWTVERIMTGSPVTVTREHAVLGALSRMTERRIRHLPVVEEGRLIGIVSIGDLVKYRIDRIEQEAAAMRDYIQTA